MSGLHHKFNVTRTDGSSEPGGRHDGCFYFVLDTDHDPYARAALRAYAEACAQDLPELSEDLLRLLEKPLKPKGARQKNQPPGGA